MPEVVGAFSSTELWHERANCFVECGNRPRGKLAQQSFEFAVRQLDWIEVWRIGRQQKPTKNPTTGVNLFSPPNVPASCGIAAARGRLVKHLVRDKGSQVSKSCHSDQHPPPLGGNLRIRHGHVRAKWWRGTGPVGPAGGTRA